MKKVTVIQARLSSTRLPGKVLLPLGSGTVLSEMVARVKRAEKIGTLVVAIPLSKENDLLIDECRKIGVQVVRGSERDLLDRHYRAAQRFEADVIVKIPSDCPLICPRVIDRVIERFETCDGCDYASNLHPQTYPDGNDVEVMSYRALESAWTESIFEYEREHTTPYIWDNPDRFRVINVEWETGLDYARTHRWVLDYPEDYQAIRQIYSDLYRVNPEFGLEDIVDLLSRKPNLRQANAMWNGKSWFSNPDHKFKNSNFYRASGAGI